MKYCIKCQKKIIENNKNTKWCMIITKKGKKVIEFECFHFECWRRHFEEAVQEEIKDRNKK